MVRDEVGDRVLERENRPAGVLTGRYIQARILGKDDPSHAALIAERSNWIERDQVVRVCKATIGAESLESEAGLLGPVNNDLMALMPRFSGFDRLPGFRRAVPNTRMIVQTSGATSSWNVPGGPIRFNSNVYSSMQMQPRRVSGGTVVAKELVQSANPEALQTMSNDLARSIGEAVDVNFFNPYSSGSPDTSPGSITSSGRLFTSNGSDLDSIDSDFQSMIDELISKGSNLAGAHWVAGTRTAAYLSRVRGTNGSRGFPNVGVHGGDIYGIPVVVSGNITGSGSPSPGTSWVHLIDPTRIWVLDMGIVSRTSDQTSVEMSEGPANDSSSGQGANLVSMYQSESVAVAATRLVNWRVAGDGTASCSLRVEF